MSSASSPISPFGTAGRAGSCRTGPSHRRPASTPSPDPGWRSSSLPDGTTCGSGTPSSGTGTFPTHESSSSARGPIPRTVAGSSSWTGCGGSTTGSRGRTTGSWTSLPSATSPWVRPVAAAGAVPRDGRLRRRDGCPSTSVRLPEAQPRPGGRSAGAHPRGRPPAIGGRWTTGRPRARAHAGETATGSSSAIRT